MTQQLRGLLLVAVIALLAGGIWAGATGQIAAALTFLCLATLFAAFEKMLRTGQ